MSAPTGCAVIASEVGAEVEKSVVKKERLSPEDCDNLTSYLKIANSDLLFYLVLPQIAAKVNLWQLVQEKLLQIGAKNSNSNLKFQMILDETAQLLDQLSRVVHECCDESAADNDTDQLIRIDNRLTGLTGSSSFNWFKLKPECLEINRFFFKEEEQEVEPSVVEEVKPELDMSDDDDSNYDDEPKKMSKKKRGYPPYPCRECKREYSSSKTLKRHLRTGKCHSARKPGRPDFRLVGNRYFCVDPACLTLDGQIPKDQASWACREELWAHIGEVHVNENEAVPCDKCHRKYPTDELLKIHVKKEHEYKFTCRFCGAPCRSSTRLRNHERRHTGEKPYACDQCPYKANFRTALEAHKARLHDPSLSQKKHMCDLCGKSFFTKTCLKEHVFTHTDTKRYTCELCGKQLRNNSCHRRHMMCVHGVKMTCHMCNKDVYTKKGMQQHLKLVHNILP